MGLDISSKSEKSYHSSYGGLHQVRWMAYKSLGGIRDYGMWHQLYSNDEKDSKDEKSYEEYPNLMWHSDCDGTYTPDGKIDNMDKPENNLTTGNSVELLKELRLVKERLDERLNKYITEHDWAKFNMLYDLVEDVVENHDGVLEFC